MYLQHESNPHFLSPPLSPPQSQRPQRPQFQLSPQSPNLSLPPGYNAPPSRLRSPPPPPRIKPKRRPHDQTPILPMPRRSTHDQTPIMPPRSGLNQYPDEDTRSPILPPRSGLNQYPDEDTRSEEQRFGQHGNQPPHTRTSRPWPSRLHEGRHHPDQHNQPQPRPSDIRVPTSRKTKPIAWLIAAACTLFWLIIIVGGLIVLIVYLVFKPRLPKFDIANASLNAAYLDMDYLLNADLTLLANFTNPNTKVDVDFNFAILNVYHEENFIATRYVEPFLAIRRQSKFETVHMISSQVPLSLKHSQDLKTQMENGRVVFDIKGFFRARSNFGFLSYSYWLYSHCTITLTGPPAGIMIGKKCITKR